MGVRTLRDVSAARTLRAELVALAMAVDRVPGRTETLRLVQPRLSVQRIEDEWRAVSAVLRPKVVERLSLQVVFLDGHSMLFGASGDPILEAPATPGQAPPGQLRLGRRDLSFAAEKMLIWAWLAGEGPITRAWLQRTAGCTYPTVAAVLKRLGNAVLRHPDRRVELRHVPREEWARFFAVSGAARSVRRFADRSDQPTSAAALLRRVRHLAPPGVAVGGVAAARHYLPDLDLVGLPRLDLSVHAPGRDVDVDFVRRLDPALEPVADPADPAVVVLHFVRHQEPLFAATDGVPWADPVECLLDLHEAGLEPQALEFLDRLQSGAGASV